MLVDCGRFVVERFILNVETEDSLTCVDVHMLADMFESFSSTLQLSVSLLSMCAYLSQCLWLSPLKSSSLAISLRYWASLYSSLSFSRLRWAFMKGRIYQTQTHTKQVSSNMWAQSWQWWGREHSQHRDGDAGRLPSVRSVDSWGSFVRCHQTLWCSSCCKILRISPISHPEASPGHRHVRKHIIYVLLSLSQSQKHQEETCYYFCVIECLSTQTHTFSCLCKVSFSCSKCILTQTNFCCISRVCYCRSEAGRYS